LSEKYGKFNIYVIAKWLGHSPEVMLKHYGRFQKSDLEQIADACERIKQEKGQTVWDQGGHFVPFLPQNKGLTVESTAPNHSEGVAQKAAQYTAVGCGIGDNEGESGQAAVLLHLPQIPENTVPKGKKWNRAVPCGSPQNPANGRYRIRTYDP